MGRRSKRLAGNILGLAICLFMVVYLNDCKHYQERQARQDSACLVQMESDAKQYELKKLKE